jgi:hypothetical protein
MQAWDGSNPSAAVTQRTLAATGDQTEMVIVANACFICEPQSALFAQVATWRSTPASLFVLG